ncbi:MAG: hypothetical protein EOP06_31535 [Proteobacteria bacterium]|nr:MAG: hypothetical protein EOP06_31535 [Pseudomonadota bacterium]
MSVERDTEQVVPGVLMKIILPTLSFLLSSLSSSISFAAIPADDPRPIYLCQVDVVEASEPNNREYISGFDFSPGRTNTTAKWSSREAAWRAGLRGPAFHGEARVSLDSYGNARLSFLRDDGVFTEALSYFAVGASMVRAELTFHDATGEWVLKANCQHQ